MMADLSKAKQADLILVTDIPAITWILPPSRSSKQGAPS
jgi:hypothetical protein